MKLTYRLAILQSHPIQYFSPLFKRLAQHPNIDLTVYYCSPQGAEGYEDTGFGQRIKWDVPLLEGYRYKFLPNRRRTAKVGGFLSLVNPSVFSELRKNRFDYLWVHGHNYFTFVLAILAARALNCKVLMRSETHLSLKRSPLKVAVRRPIMHLFYRWVCSACLPIGTRNREFYQFHGVGENRLFTVPYTVDNEFFIEEARRARNAIEQLKTDLGLPTHKPTILFASKLVARKRPLDLLMAYHKLREQQREAVLAIVGAGDQESVLMDYARRHNLKDVYFLGFRNQSELPKLYALADIFVLPSEDEPWGLIINEVMCAGVPIIASQEIGAVPDLVRNGYNGLVFPAGDVDALAKHIDTLLMSRDLRKQMGENSLSLIRGWDIERCVRGVEQALSNLVKS